MTDSIKKISDRIAGAVQFPGGTGPGGQAISARSSRSRNADKQSREPQPNGFNMDEMNSRYSMVLMGSKCVVYFEDPNAPLEGKKRVLSKDGFKDYLANHFTEQRCADGKIRTMTWATAWIQNPKRKTFSGIEFFPDPNNAPGTPGYLNLWSGFAVEPARKPDALRYKTFRDHLLNNVCRSDEKLFNWVFAFFAHMVQRPRERIGVSLVLKGKMGSGKTKVGEVIGSLFPQHHFLVDNPRYVTGNFNAHMATCLLLQSDEAVWAGDKAAEGRLKGLITSPIQQIEAKGVDPIRLPNYVRLIMTSNEDWSVPAGVDERRFCVLEVDPRCAKNHEYFREMDEELNSGGREALLADLLAFDLETVNVREIYKTDALLQEKLNSLDHVKSWWYERLVSGVTARGGEAWQTLIPCERLYDDYIAVADRIGVKRKTEQTRFGTTLHKLIPDLQKTRPAQPDGTRALHYVLPSLERCRAAFEHAIEQAIDWEPGEQRSDGQIRAMRETGKNGGEGL